MIGASIGFGISAVLWAVLGWILSSWDMAGEAMFPWAMSLISFLIAVALLSRTAWIALRARKSSKKEVH